MRWISVKAKLPKLGEKVLFLTANGEQWVGRYAIASACCLFCADSPGSSEGTMVFDVTHWKYLEKPSRKASWRRES